jgi:hypothetical protein
MRITTKFISQFVDHFGASYDFWKHLHEINKNRFLFFSEKPLGKHYASPGKRIRDHAELLTAGPVAPLSSETEAGEELHRPELNGGEPSGGSVGTSEIPAARRARG